MDYCNLTGSFTDATKSQLAMGCEHNGMQSTIGVEDMKNVMVRISVAHR